MGFSLTIQEGKDQGRQYSFDQPEVTIGRTAENDVVLYDPGVSRRHVVIRQEAGRIYVQDMGSANGTQVNGNAVSEEELQTGDLVSVGPVVFAFEVAENANSTRIVDPEEIRAKRSQAKSSQQQLRATAPIPSAARRPSSLARPQSTALAPPRSAALAKPGSKGGVPARPKPQQKAPMLASERARLMRQNAGPIGKIKIWFIEAPKPVRLGVIGAGVLLALLVLGVGVWRFVHVSGPGIIETDFSHKPFKISETMNKEIFGLGEELGVTKPTKDEVHFEFEYSEPVPQVYYVRFEPLGIERKEEVEITLNGVHLGFANASIGDYTKAQRIKLPKKYLKAGIPNEIVFDNVDNPPKQLSWAIAKVKLLIKPLPKCVDKDECLREAKKLSDAADQLYTSRDIAAENRYRSWTNLHRSLLFLENVEPKPEMYANVQGTLREVDRDLDDVCKKFMLQAKKFEELGNQRKALASYKDGLMYFPAGEDEHSCRAQLQEKIEEYGDTGPGTK